MMGKPKPTYKYNEADFVENNSRDPLSNFDIYDVADDGELLLSTGDPETISSIIQSTTMSDEIEQEAEDVGVVVIENYDELNNEVVKQEVENVDIVVKKAAKNVSVVVIENYDELDNKVVKEEVENVDIVVKKAAKNVGVVVIENYDELDNKVVKQEVENVDIVVEKAAKNVGVVVIENYDELDNKVIKQEAKNVDIVVKKEAENVDNSPVKTCKLPNVSSPFKNALIWPSESKSKNKKRTPKVKLPSVLTSCQWQEYQNDKILNKHQQEQEKIQRQEERVKKRECKKELADIQKTKRAGKKLEREKEMRDKALKKTEKENKKNQGKVIKCKSPAKAKKFKEELILTSDDDLPKTKKQKTKN